MTRLSPSSIGKGEYAFEALRSNNGRYAVTVVGEGVGISLLSGEEELGATRYLSVNGGTVESRESIFVLQKFERTNNRFYEPITVLTYYHTKINLKKAKDN